MIIGDTNEIRLGKCSWCKHKPQELLSRMHRITLHMLHPVSNGSSCEQLSIMQTSYDTQNTA